MSETMIILAVAGGIALIILMWGIAIYNRLIALKNRFVNAFAQIDVQLQRRYDLIPNLVETAKSYMEYEKDTLTQVIEARNTARGIEEQVAKKPDDPAKMQELMKAEATLTRSMGQFFALAENYPDLKANQTMKQLMEELTTTENKVAFARQAYNDAVMVYNTYRAQFPNVIISNMSGYSPATFFEVQDEEAKKPVKVSFK